MPGRNDDMNQYTASDIAKYWNGELTPAQMNAMERASLDDPFLADAMEGFGQLEANHPGLQPAHLAELKERLSRRISNDIKKPFPNNWWKPAIAAILIISAGIGGYLLLLPKNESEIIVVKPTVQATAPDRAKAKPSPAVDTSHPLPGDVAVLGPKQKIMPSPQLMPSSPKPGSIELNTEKLEDGKETEPAAVTAKMPVPSDAKQEEKYVIRGVVRNQQQQPVEGASVSLAGKAAGINVVTDAEGRFQIPVTDTAAQLKITSAGYESNELLVLVADSNKDLAVNLKPASNAADEVVAEGYGARKRSAAPQQQEKQKDLTVKVQNAIPVIGWNDYNEYLKKNMVIPDSLVQRHGNVVVYFEVTTKGKLSEFSIEQSLHPTLDSEAIRLVKEGPAWKILKGRKAGVYVIVPF
ncbi:energy transducer TonB [Flavihumibacter profundi]|jgi:hypothetical protein|uniref:energy transducer TonB n=1 Tax=Flavihumibacter profundi TaxID=2716883 RepID=UPI001CC7134C|nr:carboxypeptidase-like regulatory domain-containing protein [Flavihumibacter profundi]MBZ5857024.1 carboxypeptidase-like regulatory domain-containing protein [Flavihumibacter profundi]